MRDLVDGIMTVIAAEYELYRELFFNELDKGTLLYFHEMDQFSTINEASKKIINDISALMSRKNDLIASARETEKATTDMPMRQIVEKYAPDRLGEFDALRENFKKLLDLTHDINVKNTSLLNTSYMMTRNILSELMGENKVYNSKGSIREPFVSTVRYNV